MSNIQPRVSKDDFYKIVSLVFAEYEAVDTNILATWYTLFSQHTTETLTQAVKHIKTEAKLYGMPKSNDFYASIKIALERKFPPSLKLSASETYAMGNTQMLLCQESRNYADRVTRKCDSQYSSQEEMQRDCRIRDAEHLKNYCLRYESTQKNAINLIINEGYPDQVAIVMTLRESPFIQLEKDILAIAERYQQSMLAIN